MRGTREVELVAAAAATLAPIAQREDRWAHLSLCVLDAVFSLGARYTTTCRTVRDYAAHAGLSHVLEPADQVAAGMFARSEEPVTALRERIEDVGPADFAQTVVHNRQRTSARGGVLKAEAALQLTGVLEQHGVLRLADVSELLVDDTRLAAVERDLDRVPGHGTNGVRTGYLWMLAGSDTIIKPDRMVLGWLTPVLGRVPSVPEARELVAAAAGELGVSAWQLDHAIWSAQRSTSRRRRQRGALEATPQEVTGPGCAAPATRICARCGAPADWLVTAGTRTPSRLLAYCDPCRFSAATNLALVVPLAVLDVDQESLLTALYRAGVTRTAPEYVGDNLAVPLGGWSLVADALIARDERPEEPR